MIICRIASMFHYPISDTKCNRMALGSIR
jgi:hypothetical protein